MPNSPRDAPQGARFPQRILPGGSINRGSQIPYDTGDDVTLGLFYVAADELGEESVSHTRSRRGNSTTKLNDLH